MKSVPALFAERPTSAAVYTSLVGVLDDFGPFVVEEKKSSLHIVAGKAAFLGVHPRKDGLRINLVLARPLEGDRIAKCERVSANRFHNEVNVRKAAEIDETLTGWLREAYDRVNA